MSHVLQKTPQKDRGITLLRPFLILLQLEASYGEERAEAIIKNVIWEDSPLTVQEHLSLLSEVSFAEADILWKKNVFAPILVTEEFR